MKKVLALGDSLIAGDYGASLLESSRFLGKAALINCGQNGEPLKGIVRHLKVQLKSEGSPDILIMDGGANDILIPYMKKHHPKEWGPFFRKLARHGSTPVESDEEFLKLIKTAFNRAFESGIKTIIFLTIPCLGEDPDHPLNRERERVNQIIRNFHSSFTGQGTVILGDLGKAFDRVMASRQPPSTWLFTSPSDLNKPFTPDRIKERNLAYTIDGVHLNTEGARLCAGVLDEVLKNVLS